MQTNNFFFKKVLIADYKYQSFILHKAIHFNLGNKKKTCVVNVKFLYSILSSLVNGQGLFTNHINMILHSTEYQTVHCVKSRLTDCFDYIIGGERSINYQCGRSMLMFCLQFEVRGQSAINVEGQC